MARQCAVLLLALAVPALGASVQSIVPNTGFPFGYTTVEIHGESFVGFNGGFTCDRAVPGCPVRVFFGVQGAYVDRVSFSHILVSVPPAPEGTVVDVRIELPDGTQLTIPNGFRYATTPSVPTRLNYRGYLVPLRPGELRGSNGSLWRTDLIAHNASDALLQLIGDNCTAAPGSCGSYIDVGSSVSRNLDFTAVPGENEGTLLYLPEPLAHDSELEMRVRDVSRDAEGLGTEIPIVPLGDFSPRIRLLDVPVDPRYRIALRVYSLFDNLPVHVTVYPLSGGTPIERRELRLKLNGAERFQNQFAFPLVASYARLDPISDAVRASGHTRVRIELHTDVFPRADPPLHPEFWAFASITNNVTQQVTTVVPHAK